MGCHIKTAWEESLCSYTIGGVTHHVHGPNFFC
jgi:hypothetical protein